MKQLMRAFKLGLLAFVALAGIATAIALGGSGHHHHWQTTTTTTTTTASTAAAPPNLWTTPATSYTACASTDCGSYAITLNWGNFQGLAWTPTGYNMFECSGASCTPTQVGTTASQSYSFYGMDCGTAFTLGVQAKDNSSNTSQTYTTSYTTPACAGSSAPANTASPTVSGLAFVKNTVSTTNGTWTVSGTSHTCGDGTLTCSYQWQDCNSSGTGCANITGATSSSYTVALADAGSELKAQVTATANSQNATAGTVYPAAGTGTVPGSTGYMTMAAFNGAYDTYQTGYSGASPPLLSGTSGAGAAIDGWNNGYGWVPMPTSHEVTNAGDVTWPANSFVADGPGSNQDMTTTDCAWSSWQASAFSAGNYNIGCAGGDFVYSESQFGDQEGLTLHCVDSANAAGAYTNTCPMTGKSTATPTVTGSAESWMRFRVYFSSTGYVPDPNGYNWLIEQFNEPSWCGNCHPIALGIMTDSATCTTQSPDTTAPVCTTAGTNPSWLMQYAGGNSATNPSNLYHQVTMPSNSLQLNTWYDVVWHTTYSTTSGTEELWLNTGSGWTQPTGFSVTGVPTAYYYNSTTPDCNTSGNACVPVVNNNLEQYREVLNQQSAVKFQDLVIGSSAASVGVPQL